MSLYQEVVVDTWNQYVEKQDKSAYFGRALGAGLFVIVMLLASCVGITLLPFAILGFLVLGIKKLFIALIKKEGLENED